MKKTSKRSIFSAVLALMLVASVGFFTSLSPTTAWFTASQQAFKDFDMGKIDVDYNGTDKYINLKFSAATKVLDSNELSEMFEFAAQFYTFSITNNDSDSMDARLIVDLANVPQDSGLHYLFFEYDDNDIELCNSFDTIVEEAPAVGETARTPGVYGTQVSVEGTKEYYDRVIERVNPNQTNEYQRFLFKRTDNEKRIKQVVEELSSQALEQSISDKDGFISFCENKQIELAQGDTKQICLVLWVEYDNFIAVEGDPVRTLEFENISVDIKPVQPMELLETTTSANP